MSRIRVLLVDDHNLVREGLRARIEAQADMEVVAEAETAVEGHARALELQPDVVVMDLTMPGGGELQAIRQIHEQCPATRVLALTMHDDPAKAREVMAAGGAGYLTKRAATAELLAAIRAVKDGRAFISVSLDRAGTGSLPAPGPPAARPAPPAGPLTPREAEVLVLLARGHSSREAAEALGIGSRTVETHRARIAEKLGLQSRTGLVRYAMDHGLLDRRL